MLLSIHHRALIIVVLLTSHGLAITVASTGMLREMTMLPVVRTGLGIVVEEGGLRNGLYIHCLRVHVLWFASFDCINSSSNLVLWLSEECCGWRAAVLKAGWWGFWGLDS